MKKKVWTPCLLYVLLIGASLWLIGFIVFCLYALSFRFHPAEPTDAIVVLTGGGERVQMALTLLEERYADHLLISGVNQQVALSDLAGQLPADLAQNVTLGYQAQDTRGNAREVAQWIDGRPIRTILLVTSFYHMPRGIFEVLRQSPDLKIVPLPVFPRSFDDSVDWIRTRYAWLLFVEYHKYLAIRACDFFERI